MKEPVKQRSVEAEYEKTGIKPEDIAVLREWVKTQPHLPAEHITDLDLILTYNSCGRSTEVSKQVLDLNLTLRTHFTNLFEDRKIDEHCIEVLKALTFVRLDVPNNDNIAYIYYQLSEQGSKYDNLDSIRIIFMLLDLWQYEDGTYSGIIFITDLSGITAAHVTKMNMQAVQNAFCFVQEALYMNIIELHYINVPSLMDKILYLTRPFMKKGLLDMLKIHQPGSQTIGNYFPIDVLPIEAGGRHKTMVQMQNETIDYLVANKQFFIDESKKRVNESLRPGKPKSLTDIFGGIEGSFKQLNID